MAKRKRTALFEVIQKDKRLGRAGGALPMPNWYTAGKGLMPPVPPPQMAAQPPVVSHARARSGPSFSEIVLGKARQMPLTRTSVAIIAAAAMLALGVTMIWMHWGFSGGSGTPNATAALNGPAHPEVMDIPVPKTPERSAIQSGSAAPQQATPAASVQSPVRQVNLSYVCIRLYNSQKSANATRDLLSAHDVACTVEHNIPGVQLPLYAVMGLKPFATAGTAEYSDYIGRIKAILVAGGDTRGLSPRLVKWVGSAQTE
jgi:hypothetical protein